MLLKVYGHGIGGSINIIDKISHVRVHTGMHKKYHDDSINLYYEFQEPGCGGVGTEYCLIDFNHDNLRCRALVSNFAYVCNDEGKTVQKVSTVN